MLRPKLVHHPPTECNNLQNLQTWGEMECQNAENQGDKDSEAQVQKPLLPKQKIMDKNITSYHSIATPDPSTALHDVASKPSNGGGRLLGFILTILAGISFTAMSTMIKLLPRESSWQILFLRSLRGLKKSLFRYIHTDKIFQF